jgi:hypothetical protein
MVSKFEGLVIILRNGTLAADKVYGDRSSTKRIPNISFYIASNL